MGDNSEAERALNLMGSRYRASLAKTEPVGDRMINAFRGAIWEAWEKGLDGKSSVYPSVPLLEQLVYGPER